MKIMFQSESMFQGFQEEDKVSQEKKEKAEELMLKHRLFFGHFQKEDQYVTSGSVLWCDGGSHMMAFDVGMSHGVERGEKESLGVCEDCEVNYNIYSFGGCKYPTPEGCPGRRLVVVDGTSSRVREMDRCTPLLDKSWQKTKKANLRIWDFRKKKFCDALTTGDYLTCFYGGRISVLEVPHVVYPEDYRRENSENINCYGYAFGIESLWYPGGRSFSEGNAWTNEAASLEELAQYVLNDMKALHISARVIRDPAECGPDEYVVAMKSSTKLINGTTDYHFAVQLSDGTWEDKQGACASRWNCLDGTDDTWDMYEGDGYYNTESVYFAVNKKDVEKAREIY